MRKSENEKRAVKAMRSIVLATDDGNVPEWVLQEAETLNRAMWLMERNYAAKECTGASKLAEMERRAVRCLPFGVHEVDEVLQGGAREGQVLELVGEPGSGKTQMCMMLTAMTASRGERVVYVDTNNAFSGERLAWLMQRIGLKQSVSVNSIRCMTALFFAYYADYSM
jgi:RecA/RadA recombinase